jgi:hypothetical protein
MKKNGQGVYPKAIFLVPGAGIMDAVFTGLQRDLA